MVLIPTFIIQLQAAIYASEGIYGDNPRFEKGVTVPGILSKETSLVSDLNIFHFNKCHYFAIRTSYLPF